ncbi:MULTISPECIES: hypothetical protein [unclassified Arcicella]|uniref:hypothetical protein n=1 Tax=unclassified Arcicella TaxID=2644986 RepID=UPI002862F224|nr:MULTISPECIES: hypothetical protein [unclassified Arcicella]MDR6561081.1 hypothetical protein [Arcicella sp. BE51]MDR6810965.1 hypothetical protein [Arcicella sp. BE140]MDR6822315.1 hypothetical protein [Arcicella sp. BE139]
MQNSIHNGGETHVKYAHFHFPRTIDVQCPFCSQPSELVNINASMDTDFFIDLAPYQKVWTLICNHCLNRKSMSWDDTKKIELLNKITIREETIWAWNTHHLHYLIGVFSGKEDKNHKWAFYRNYIHKKWFQKTANKSDILKLENLLSTNIKSFKRNEI